MEETTQSHIIALWRFKSSYDRAETRAFLGTEVNRDYDLVTVTMKLKLKKNLQNHGPRLEFCLEKLRDLQVSDLFDAPIGGKFAVLNLLEKKKQIISQKASMEHLLCYQQVIVTLVISY